MLVTPPDLKLDKVEAFIKVVEESHPDMVALFTQGQCYNFHLILKQVFPKAEGYWSHREGHCYTKIGRCYYDIRGKIGYLPVDLFKMSQKDHENAAEWAKNETRRLSMG